MLCKNCIKSCMCYSVLLHLNMPKRLRPEDIARTFIDHKDRQWLEEKYIDEVKSRLV